MRIWQRAALYVRRKAGKSVLMLLVMLLLFSFVMTGMLLYRAADLAIQQTRQTLGGGFRIAPDMQNQEHIIISEADGQTRVDYVGTPLDEALIQAVRAKDEINAHNAVLRGEILLQKDLRLIDYNGLYRHDPMAAHLATVEADTDPSLSFAFESALVKLSAGEMPGESGAVISEALAKENHLTIGDEIALSPREAHAGQPVSVTVTGLFTVTADQQNTDIAAPVHLLENKIYLDMASGRALLGASGADYIDFLINDPAQVNQVIDEIRAINGIEWSCFSLTASVEEYEKAAEPLLSIRGLARTLLSVMVVASAAVLSLIQALFSTSRQHETGIMLSVGIAKGEILLQRFAEAVLIAAAALVLSAIATFLIWPLTGSSIAGRIEVMAAQTGAVPTIAMLAAAAAWGVVALLLSTVLSSVGVMRLNPKEILSKLS